MIVCLFFVYLGFEVIYYCSEGKQMKRPKKYMRNIIKYSFLKYCVIPSEWLKESIEFYGKGQITIENLSEGAGRSPRADVVVFDEEAQVDEDAYNAAEYVLQGSDLGLTVHTSTPVLGTTFNENYDRLKQIETEIGAELVFERKYNEIHFLVDTPEKVAAYEMKKRKQAPWFFRQENECSFELRSGAVFRDVIYEPYSDELQELIRDQIDCSGIDWNPAAGHCLGSIKWLPDYSAVVVTHEINLGPGYALELSDSMFKKIIPWFTNGNKLVIEDGGINIPYVKWFKEKLNEFNVSWSNPSWRKEEWDNQDIAKMAACTYIMQHGITIYVDKVRFPDTAKCIRETHWDEDAKGSNPKLAKDKSNSPHFLDTFLHAISDKNRSDYNIEMGRFY
ncbi:MAG: hypothetical protein GY853_01040 [PVC group bacterium]|nr:hypothetical protein [PVC group bacterium]